MKNKYHLYSSMPMLTSHKAYAEIDLRALKNNYIAMCKLIGGKRKSTAAICVLKADAYGHGAKNCCRALLEEGCRFFAVSSIEEAIDIRAVCNELSAKASILILGYTLPSQARLLAEHDIITSLVDADFARELADEALKAGVRVRCHVKLDTGMNRIGFCARNDADITQTVAELESIATYPSLDICGMFTHLSKADEELEESRDSDEAFTRKQVELFRRTDRALLDRGIDVKFRHVCNSAAAIGFPEYHFDACRLGITLYGVKPSPTANICGLTPVMKLCTVISHIHALPKGESVSYGGRYTADSDKLIATIPIGYADGFIRDYSGSELTVNTRDGERRAKVLGRVCMDQCMIDVTGLDARVGDKVVIFGNTPSELEMLAKMADTIEYECLCLITSRVPRIVTNN